MSDMLRHLSQGSGQQQLCAQVTQIMVPLLKFYFHEEVRQAAVQAVPELLKSVYMAVSEGKANGADMQYVKQMLDYVWQPLIDSMVKVSTPPPDSTNPRAKLVLAPSKHHPNKREVVLASRRTNQAHSQFCEALLLKLEGCPSTAMVSTTFTTTASWRQCACIRYSTVCCSSVAAKGAF